jgi:hypothetical protein
VVGLGGGAVCGERVAIRLLVGRVDVGMAGIAAGAAVGKDWVVVGEDGGYVAVATSSLGAEW